MPLPPQPGPGASHSALAATEQADQPLQQSPQAGQRQDGLLIARLTDVSKLYGTFAALRHVSFDLFAGRCYVLLGENGAGKSTLLRMLAGLLAPSYGQVRVSGQPPFEVRERIGYMSHAPMLYDEYSAVENLRYYAALYAGTPLLAPEEALRLVGLDPARKRPLRQYSQGMRQRCSLARVLLAQPALLLLDEPFSNMDRASALQMLALLRVLRSEGRTIVLTTHQRELAEPLADGLLLLEAGWLSVELPTAGSPNLASAGRSPASGDGPLQDQGGAL